MESYVPSSSPLTAEELTAYIGPKAERYRPRFEKFTRTGTTRFEFSWNNPAAFAGMWWYLYRKMYGWALADFALSVLLGWTLFVPILWGVARAVTGDYLYFRQADRKIREARPTSSAFDAPATDTVHLARLAGEEASTPGSRGSPSRGPSFFSPPSSSPSGGSGTRSRRCANSGRILRAAGPKCCVSQIR